MCDGLFPRKYRLNYNVENKAVFLVFLRIEILFAVQIDRGYMIFITWSDERNGGNNSDLILQAILASHNYK